MTLVCNFCILKNYCLFVFDYNDVSRIRLITKKMCPQKSWYVIYDPFSRASPLRLLGNLVHFSREPFFSLFPN
jgi:hypothetical protein